VALKEMRRECGSKSNQNKGIKVNIRAENEFAVENVIFSFLEKKEAKL
jgi:hypothetical protein